MTEISNQGRRSCSADSAGSATALLGSMQRLVRLPANADESAIKALYHQGVLELVVPLTEPQPAGRLIAVTVGK